MSCRHNIKIVRYAGKEYAGCTECGVLVNWEKFLVWFEKEVLEKKKK